MKRDNSYSEREKLKSEKLLDAIFAGKKTFAQFPVRVFWDFPVEKLDFALKAGVGCSKKNFKRAVHRNRIKRLLREAWRLHKQPLLDFLQENNLQMTVFLHFSDSKLPQWADVEAKTVILIEKLIQKAHEQLEKNN